jgi:hypothetical protein
MTKQMKSIQIVIDPEQHQALQEIASQTGDTSLSCSVRSSRTGWPEGKPTRYLQTVWPQIMTYT